MRINSIYSNLILGCSILYGIHSTVSALAPTLVLNGTVRDLSQIFPDVQAPAAGCGADIGLLSQNLNEDLLPVFIPPSLRVPWSLNTSSCKSPWSPDKWYMTDVAVANYGQFFFDEMYL